MARHGRIGLCYSRSDLDDDRTGGHYILSRPSSRPDRERLLALLAEHETSERVADELGVHRVTVEKWKRELGIGRRYVAEEQAAESGA